MKEQLHKRFADEGVRTLFESYLKREIEIGYVLADLKTISSLDSYLKIFVSTHYFLPFYPKSNHQTSKNFS